MNSNYVLEVFLVTCVLYYFFVSLKHNQQSSLALQQSTMSKQEKRQLQAHELQKTQQSLQASAAAAGTLGGLVGGGYHGGGQLGKFYHAAMYTPPKRIIDWKGFDIDASEFNKNKQVYMSTLGRSGYTKNIADALQRDGVETQGFRNLFTETAEERQAINKALSAEAAKDLKPGFLISEGLHADTVKLRPLQMSKELYPGKTIPMQLETTELEKQAAKYAAEEAAYLRGGIMSRFAGSSVGAAVGVAAATAVMDYFMGSDDEEGDGEIEDEEM